MAQLTAKAEANDADAQWELGSWLEDGLVNRQGEFAVKPKPPGKPHIDVVVNSGKLGVE